MSLKMQERICIDGCCEINDFVPQSEVLKLQQEADVLLYAESLSDKNLSARLSFSTKMTDYMSSGVCIWAVGNPDLAAIDYIDKEHVGLVSTEGDSIRSALLQMIHNPSILTELASSAQDCGKRNHNQEYIINTFKAALIGPCKI
jgi:hypothetical protein